MAILIKRYANRKLYNTETSRYITLKGIAKLLDEGEEVTVVDKETGEDITQVALSQILVGNQRAKEDPSDTLLTQILSRGGDALYGAIKKSVDDATDGIGEFQDRFKEFVDASPGLGKRGRGFGWDARDGHERRSPFARDEDPTASNPEAAGEDGSESGRWPRMGGLPDLRESIQSAIASAVERSDLRNLADIPRKSDLDALNENLTRVADAIERLEAALRERD
ncbi:MAG: polyhydroxyalkanoate synthesis regulator DNA-binding domain-containing protein [Myxococcota bacterium]